VSNYLWRKTLCGELTAPEWSIKHASSRNAVRASKPGRSSSEPAPSEPGRAIASVAEPEDRLNAFWEERRFAGGQNRTLCVQLSCPCHCRQTKDRLSQDQLNLFLLHSNSSYSVLFFIDCLYPTFLPDSIQFFSPRKRLVLPAPRGLFFVPPRCHNMRFYNENKLINIVFGPVYRCVLFPSDIKELVQD